MTGIEAGDIGHAPAMDTDTTGSPLFGAYAPNWFQRNVIGFTRNRRETWFGKRLCFAARRLVLTGLKRPLDVMSYDIRFRLYPKNNLCEKRILFTPQFFDVAERAHIAKTLKQGSSFVDIGANVGVYSMLAAKAGARIVAVEPQPELFARFGFNKQINGFDAIDAVQGAVGDSDGTMEIVIDEKNLGHSGAGTEGDRRITVPCMTLLGLLDGHGIAQPDLLKIDVEGAEDIILTAFFAQAPTARHPLSIILEDAPARWGTDCIALCHANGYRLTARTHMNVILSK